MLSEIRIFLAKNVKRRREEMGKKLNISTQNLFQICGSVIRARTAKPIDVKTVFTYSHANTPLGQSEHAYD